MSDTTTVEFTLTGIEPVHGRGRLVGLACVALDVAGIELVLQGVQVIRTSAGLECRAPCFRHPSGRWLPAVLLPSELRDAIARTVIEAAP